MDILQELLPVTNATTGDAVNSATVEGPSKLVEAITFSRKFIISYNVVLLILLLGYTLSFWIQRSWRVRQRTRRGLYLQASHDTGICTTQTPQDLASPSGSSHIPDTPPELAKERRQDDETTSLLRRAQPTSRSPLRFLRAWLIYQPANIPIVNKTLPSNGTSIAILFFLGLNVFYLLFRVPLSVAQSFALADRAGLLFVANLPLLYLFAAKNQPIKWLTGHSYETLNIVHRRLGEWLCFLALIHLAGMLVTWYILLSPRLSFSRFLAIKLIWLGLASFLSYELLYLTSLGSFRQRFYELFLVLHVFLQATALGFLFFHHPTSRPYVGVALAIFLIDRVIFRIGLKTRTMKADLTVLEDGETVLLSSDWQLPTSRRTRWTTRPDIYHGWKPTEHVFLTVPALSRKHIIQAHPFTIASAAPGLSTSTSTSTSTPTSTPTHAWLNFIIRAHDGFSRDLLRHAQSHPSTTLRIDGPYGSLHARETLHRSDSGIVVAGGTGIAVAHPLVWDLLSTSVDGGSDGGDGDVTSSPPRRRVTLIWIVHDSSHLDWIGRERLAELEERGLRLVVPPPTCKAGRPDVQRLLVEACFRDLQGGSGDASVSSSSSVGVVVSGPDSMNRGVRNACARLVRQGFDVDVSVEKFGW